MVIRPLNCPINEAVMFFYWSPLQTGKNSGVLPHNRLPGNQLQALTGFLCIADGLPDVPPSVNQEAGWTCGDLSLYALCSDVFSPRWRI